MLVSKFLKPRLYLVLLRSNKNQLSCLWLHNGKGLCYKSVETGIEIGLVCEVRKHCSSPYNGPNCQASMGKVGRADTGWDHQSVQVVYVLCNDFFSSLVGMPRSTRSLAVFKQHFQGKTWWTLHIQVLLESWKEWDFFLSGKCLKLCIIWLLDTVIFLPPHDRGRLLLARGKDVSLSNVLSVKWKLKYVSQQEIVGTKTSTEAFQSPFPAVVVTNLSFFPPSWLKPLGL